MLHTQNIYKHKLTVLLSGRGTTLQNLLEHNKAKKLHATVVLVVSSRADAPGLQIAKEWGIPTKTVPYSQYRNDIQKYSEEITTHIKSYEVDLVVLAGFMSRYLVPKEFERKVINIHPSLIPEFPEFCGKGFYGRRVHEAVHKAVQEKKLRYTGCTIHYVDNEYDHGLPIEKQRVKVSPKDRVEDIQQRVNDLERILYPQVIQKLLH